MNAAAAVDRLDWAAGCAAGAFDGWAARAARFGLGALAAPFLLAAADFVFVRVFAFDFAILRLLLGTLAYTAEALENRNERFDHRLTLRKLSMTGLRVGRSAPVPREIADVLCDVFGEGAREVKVIEHSWFARLHGAIATTRPRRIYLRGSAEDFFADPVLMLHEYCHVLLQWEPGQLTKTRYVWEWLKRGYWANRFEVEARDFARRELSRCAFPRRSAIGSRSCSPAPPRGSQR
jgi:hypothetical protein